MCALCVVTFLFGRRAKFFYFLLAFTFDKGITNCLKMFYHDPRPYMQDASVPAYHCSREFGNPSGHSFSSSMVAIVLVLDVFHSRHVLDIAKDSGSEKDTKSNNAHPLIYILSVSFAFLWATLIPFSRFLLGVHSLDQIVFGMSLGIWMGFTLHFLLRDHVILHICTTNRYERSYLRRQIDGRKDLSEDDRRSNRAHTFLQSYNGSVASQQATGFLPEYRKGGSSIQNDSFDDLRQTANFSLHSEKNDQDISPAQAVFYDPDL